MRAAPYLMTPASASLMNRKPSALTPPTPAATSQPCMPPTIISTAPVAKIRTVPDRCGSSIISTPMTASSAT